MSVLREHSEPRSTGKGKHFRLGKPREARERKMQRKVGLKEGRILKDANKKKRYYMRKVQLEQNPRKKRCRYSEMSGNLS